MFIAIMLLNYITLIHAAWPFTTDDAYITLRYARNWYEHHQLIWNVHSKPIEGYSNFLYVVLGYFAYVIHVNAMLFLKILGALSLIVSLIFTYLMSRFWLTMRFAMIPSLILSTMAGMYYWAVSGLETIFFQCTLLMTIYFFMRGIGFRQCLENYITRKNGVQSVFLGLSFICLCSVALARFDGLFALGVVGLLWLAQYRSARFRHRAFILYFVGFIVLYGSYFLWRWHYFGALIPNTYLCKTYAFHQFDFNTSWFSLIQFLKNAGVFVLFGLVFLIKYYKKEVLILYLSMLFYVMLFYGTDFVLNYKNHYNLPVVPYAIIFGVAGMLLVVQMFFNQVTKIIKTGCVIGLILLFSHTAYSNIDIQNSVHTYQQRSTSRIAAAAYLNQQLYPKDSVLLGDCGLIPFLLKDRRVVDLYCLNTSVYTQQCYHHKNYADCIIQQFLNMSPTFIVINSFQHQAFEPFPYLVNEKITQTARFIRHYELSAIFESNDHMNYYVFKKINSQSLVRY